MIARFLSPVLLVAGLGFGGAAAAQNSGADIYKQRCAMCHTAKPDARSGIGPNLSGVYGRAAGSTDYKYSAALKASKLKWDKPTLDRYLTFPGKMVPGTKMAVQVADKTQREKLIAYLATLKR